MDRRRTWTARNCRDIRKEKMLEVIIRACYFLYGKYKRRLRHSRYGKCSDKETLDRSRKNTGTTGATNIHRLNLYEASGLRVDTTARFLRQFVEERARFLPFYDFQPSSLTPFMREKRVRAMVPLDSGELAGDVRRKKRSGGERWERRAENNGDGRSETGRRRNKNKRREAIRLKVWTGTR